MKDLMKYHYPVLKHFHAYLYGHETLDGLIGHLEKIEGHEREEQGERENNEENEKELLIRFSDGKEKVDLKGIGELRLTLSLAEGHSLKEQELELIRKTVETGDIEIFYEDILEI